MARTVLTVSDLTFRVKDLVEQAFGQVWVSGEISNFTRATSGHCYFTLKDDRSQIKAVLWQSTARRLPFALRDGLEVVTRGTLELYAPKGTYQLVVEDLEPKGLGARELALRQLKEKLAAEGLFAAERKRPLPAVPRGIAVVTSPAGAAVRDFLEIVGRRFPLTAILVIPARMQGEGAAAEIARALRAASYTARRRPLDAVVLTRGGGSLEDLWAFNTEVVARAIAASRLPVVSAVGHEIDVTVADLVADTRAATPSEAAERLVPETAALLTQLARQQRRLAAGLRNLSTQARARLTALAARRAFVRPFERLHDEARGLDDLAARGRRALERRLERLRHQMAGFAGQMESLSPLAVLGRGYSLTERADDGQVVRTPADAPPGTRLITRLAEGSVVSRVEE